MVFISICKALYDYTPQGDNELAISEGELLYILEKSNEDDWWKAKKKAAGEEGDEPTGLIPNNYVEEAKPIHKAKALYDYTRQTDEEISFPEDSTLSVYDVSDSDWTLVGFNGEFGFAPANYIEISEEADHLSPAFVASPQLPPRAPDTFTPPHPVGRSPSSSTPAAALAGIIQGRTSEPSPSMSRLADPPSSNLHLHARKQHDSPENSDDEPLSPPAPVLPERPQSQRISPLTSQYASAKDPEPLGISASPPYNRVVSQNYDKEPSSSPSGGFRLYNINEMVSALGKKKKMPTTLGLNLATGNIMIVPEKSRNGPQQEWTAEKLTHYSIEGKHVFMELVRPSKSIDFHAGTRDTAQEIVSALGEIAGAAKAEGLREVLAASAGSGIGKRTGHILYDFMAQGDDEVTVAAGDEIVVLDDTKSDEWWKIKRLKNGNEGVVPSSYVEVTGRTAPPTDPGLKAARSFVEQNRLEEERLAKEVARATKSRGNDVRSTEVGLGIQPPRRGSSLVSGSDGDQSSSQRSKKDDKGHGRSASSSKSKPDASKIRTWTDRSGSFKVEAEFIGLKDGKIHLHKLNGVKIAVSVAKMAIEDLEYVERVTGDSLDDEKPLSDIRRRSLQAAGKDDPKKTQAPTSPEKAVVSTDKPKRTDSKASEYDWFDFFLKAGVSPYQCERYAHNFQQDSMDESVLPDITAPVLRTLGLKEGDILRVMKFLDTKYGRTGKSKLRNVSFGGEELISPDNESNSIPSNNSGGGLFSGPGGALRNNTRKGRPAPVVQNDDVVDSETFRQKGTSDISPKNPSESTSLIPLSAPEKKFGGGFDDDAWDVKPSRKPGVSKPQPPSPTTKPAAIVSSKPPMGALADLSLLSEPLQPTILPSAERGSTQQSQGQLALQSSQPTQHSGAGQLLSQFSQQATGPPPQSQLSNQAVLNLTPQPNLQNKQSPPPNLGPRQRPQPPQIPTQASLMFPPPPRPLSAPQNASQSSGFGPPPLQPQLTGAPVQFQNHIVPPGQSLNDLERARLQQQYSQQHMNPLPNAIGLQNPGFSQGTIAPQQTGFVPQFPSLQQSGFQSSQPLVSNQPVNTSFAGPRQQQVLGGFQALSPQVSGYHLHSPIPPPIQPSRTGSINSVLQPALQPQNSIVNGSGSGINGYHGSSGLNQGPPPLPSIPSSSASPLAPLQPQKTGPAPSVRFGVAPEAKKLVPQLTGRRANLSQATPQNPFGF